MPKLANALAPTKSRGVQPLSAFIPDEMRLLFEPRPIMPGEDPHQYVILLASIADDVKPTDSIEWVWVKDILDHTWEIRRLRLVKGELIKACIRKAGGRLLAPVFDPEASHYLLAQQSQMAVTAYLAGSDEAVARVTDALESLGLNEKTLWAAAFAEALPELEKIDRMLQSIEARRDKVLREIERRRFATGQRLRAASDAEVVDFKLAGRGR